MNNPDRTVKAHLTLVYEETKTGNRLNSTLSIKEGDRGGMAHFDSKVIKEIERRFFAIQKKTEKPDSCVELPRVAFA